jgi:hypothetical protein
MGKELRFALKKSRLCARTIQSEVFALKNGCF